MGAEQGTEEWLIERLGKATSSNFNKVMMGKSTAGRQEYLIQLALERIYGKPVETFKSRAMERGNELEPVARMRYMLQTKNVTSGAPPFIKHPTLEAGASLDDTVGDDLIVEYKAPLAHNHFYTLTTRKVPPVYKWQLVGQHLMSGRSKTDFVSFSDEFPPNAALAIIRFERDEKLIEELEVGLAQFLDEVNEAVKFIQEYGK